MMKVKLGMFLVICLLAGSLTSAAPPVMQAVFGGGQPPDYTFYMSKYLITNEELARFLNDAQANPGNARGANMVFAANGNVGFNASGGDWEDTLYKRTRAGVPDLVYDANQPVGSRYTVTPDRGKMPAYAVTWFGALKYCNWLTIDQGYGESQRAYNEGATNSAWRPVHLTTTQWNDGFSSAERSAWLNYKGYRLPMDEYQETTSPYNEWYKAASWNGSTNALYGYGRDTITEPDGNYWQSGDPWENDPNASAQLRYLAATPVGFYNGSLQQKSAWNWPAAVETYQTNGNDNAWGIYDLTGNVWKWMSDPYFSNAASPITIRGGSMGSTPIYEGNPVLTVKQRGSALRDAILSHTGFYVVQVLDPNAVQYCGMEGTAYLAGDVSGLNNIRDCYVNMFDIDVLSGQWLECSDPENGNCDNQAPLMVEDFSVEPTASGNGWMAAGRADIDPCDPNTIIRLYIDVNTPNGTCDINSIGADNNSPQFYMLSGQNVMVDWTNVEFIQTAYATECPDPDFLSWGNGVWVQTGKWGYVVGVKVADWGGGQYQTTVEAWNPADTSSRLGWYTLSDTGRNEHRYNIEVNDITGELNVYVDANSSDLPVITATAGVSNGRALYFGDLRGGGATSFKPNGHALWNKVSFSMMSLMSAPLCGMEGTMYLDADVSGPSGLPDCYVDFYDFVAVFADQWMQCTDPANENCI